MRCSTEHFLRYLQIYCIGQPILQAGLIENSNVYKLLLFIAQVYFSQCQDTQRLYQYNKLEKPDLDILNILEENYGLPDDVFENQNTYEERLFAVQVKKFLTEVGVSDIASYRKLAKLFGIDQINIIPYPEYNGEGFTYQLSFYFFGISGSGYGLWIVQLPKDLLGNTNSTSLFKMELSFEFDNKNTIKFLQFQKLLNKLKPSHVEIEYQFIL
jgi:hypothetical protein